MSLVYEALTILFLSHTIQREGGSLLKVSCPNLSFPQCGLLSLFSPFDPFTSLKGQILKALHFYRNVKSHQAGQVKQRECTALEI